MNLYMMFLMSGEDEYTKFASAVIAEDEESAIQIFSGAVLREQIEIDQSDYILPVKLDRVGKYRVIVEKVEEKEEDFFV